MQLVFYKGLRGITFIAGGIFRKNLALGALYTNVHPNIIQTRKQMLHTSIAVLEHGVWGWGFEMFPRVWGLESRHFQTLKFISQNWNCQRGKNGTLFLLYLYICTGKPNTGRPHFIELFFIALRRYCGGFFVVCLFVYKLKVYGNPTSNKLSAPFFPTAFAYSAVQAVSLLSLLPLSMISDLWHYYKRLWLIEDHDG